MNRNSKYYANINNNENIYENFSSYVPIVEFGFADASNDINTTTTSDSTAITTTDTVNNTTNTSATDNSIVMDSNVNTNTQIDSSQNISNETSTDNSSIQDITSSTDSYNIDNSETINNISNTTSNKLIQSCGMTLEQANAAVNIVKDESINTNIDASNTLIVTGNSNTITDVRLESEIDFEGGDIDRSCVLDAVNDMQSELDAVNENSKQMSGGEGGNTDTGAGGNTTENANVSEKTDALDAGVDGGQSAENTATTENENKAENTTENTTENTQTNDQGIKTTTSTGLFAGGLTENLMILIGLLSFYVILNDKVNITKLINLIKSNYILLISIFIYFFNI
jgi:hypothetical protein